MQTSSSTREKFSCQSECIHRRSRLPFHTRWCKWPPCTFGTRSNQGDLCSLRITESRDTSTIMVRRCWPKYHELIRSVARIYGTNMWICWRSCNCAVVLRIVRSCAQWLLVGQEDTHHAARSNRCGPRRYRGVRTKEHPRHHRGTHLRVDLRLFYCRDGIQNATSAFV